MAFEWLKKLFGSSAPAEPAAPAPAEEAMAAPSAAPSAPAEPAAPAPAEEEPKIE